MLRLSKVRKIAFSFSLRSPCTIFRQDRRRFGNENKKRIFSFHCARLALSLDKIGCGSAMKIKNVFFLFIALALHYLCKKN